MEYLNHVLLHPWLSTPESNLVENSIIATRQYTKRYVDSFIFRDSVSFGFEFGWWFLSLVVITTLALNILFYHKVWLLKRKRDLTETKSSVTSSTCINDYFTEKVLIKRSFSSITIWHWRNLILYNTFICHFFLTI